jgi:HEAT repeat protein
VRLEELMRWFLQGGRAAWVSEGEGDLWLTEVAARIARTGSKGIAFLLSCLPKADDARLRAILTALSLSAKGLSTRRRAEVCGCVRPLLADARPLVVADAVDALRHLGCRDALDKVLPLLQHPSAYVVGSALRFLARHDPQRTVPLLEAVLKSPEPIMRQNALDELDDLGHVASLPKIRQLLKDPDQDVRQAALTAVENLEGD